MAAITAPRIRMSLWWMPSASVVAISPERLPQKIGYTRGMNKKRLAALVIAIIVPGAGAVFFGYLLCQQAVRYIRSKLP